MIKRKRAKEANRRYCLSVLEAIRGYMAARVGLYAALSVAFRRRCRAKGPCLHVELVVWSGSMQSAALHL